MKQTFNYLLIFLVGLVTYSCGSNAEKPDSGDKTVKSEELVIDTALVAGQRVEGLADYEITKETALGRLHAFQMTNPDLTPSSPNYISVPLNEFQVLANELDPTTTYAAFAKNGDELEIIFVGKPKAGGDDWRYFNFTKPCPPACVESADTARISTGL